MTTEAHARISQDIENYIMSGGKIQKLPSGVQRPALLELWSYGKTRVVNVSSARPAGLRDELAANDEE